uniref:Transposase n=1 Tax=Heterorhabditis bacteriophora TaxID=37862 RepID=A0A1I7W633_HETBA
MKTKTPLSLYHNQNKKGFFINKTIENKSIDLPCWLVTGKASINVSLRRAQEARRMISRLKTKNLVNINTKICNIHNKTIAY